MTDTTAELDTTKEEHPGANGHSEETGLRFDDFAFTKHIASIKPVEELVAVPEWQGLEVLCKPLPPADRLVVHSIAYDKETGITDYKRAEFEVLLGGCYNPTTGKKAFRESHRAMLMGRPEKGEVGHGAAVERLYFTIMRISKMFVNQQEQAKKN